MICLETFKQSFCTGQAQEPITRAFIHIKLKNLTPKVYTGLTFNLYKIEKNYTCEFKLKKNSTFFSAAMGSQLKPLWIITSAGIYAGKFIEINATNNRR